jgi:drug/metabolite transporter (DMT)-like permease
MAEGGQSRTGIGPTLLYTGIALVSFAANSILCRLALGRSAADPAGFTAVRLAAGAAALLLFTGLSRRRGAKSRKSGAGWVSAFLLFSYATTFSFAYVTLSAGTGALILFGSVQATMILVALGAGERFHVLDATGLAMAVAGLVALVAPGLAAPSPVGAALMAIAGISWGIYSLRGRGALDPLADTAGNFLRTLPFAAGLGVLAFRGLHVSRAGFAWAVLSGALASGAGYVVWYAALRGLTAIRAATVQLAVPILAACGGVLFLSERVSLRLLLSAALILGGIGLALAGRARSRPTT